ncbi:MAG TPA: NAD(P)H-binding protein [Streptosporangiaceae bacterium]|jgi:putative NADH-flavin reductase
MELVVMGATGRIGRLAVGRALAGGHWVTAFTRHPGEVASGPERLAVVPGDVTDAGAVRDVIAGKDAVIYALGVKSRSTTTVFSEGITNVVQAMEAKGVRRVMAVSTAALDESVRISLLRRFVATYIVERVMRNIYLDLARMEDELEMSDTDWTVVRAAALTDGTAAGDYRTASEGLVRPGRIGRADLAGYLVSNLASAQTYHKKVTISY